MYIYKARPQLLSAVLVPQSERRFKPRRITELLRSDRETVAEYNQRDMRCAPYKLSEQTALSIS